MHKHHDGVLLCEESVLILKMSFDADFNEEMKRRKNCKLSITPLAM
jgi:hypothetical protein